MLNSRKHLTQNEVARLKRGLSTMKGPELTFSSGNEHKTLYKSISYTAGQAHRGVGMNSACFP